MKILINFFSTEDQETKKDKLYAEVIPGFEGTLEEVKEDYHWCDFYVDSILYDSENIPQKIKVSYVKLLS